MSVDLSNVPTLDAVRVRRGGFRPSRREVLGGALAIAGAAALGVFQRPAWAHTVTSTDYAVVPGSNCGGVLSWPACGGCETQNRIIGGCCHAGDPAGTCPQGAGWHKHNHGNGFDLRPNVCPTGPGSSHSAWRWVTSVCCFVSSGVCRTNRKWRCHDGWIGPDKSICRWVIDAGDSCGPCPI